MACAICEKRKEKRFCPAVHGRICTQCCGEQREITLDCPSDCVYLEQAREHEKPRSISDLDQSTLFLKVEISDQFLYEQEQLILGLTYSLAKSARSPQGLHDSDFVAALSSLSRSYETLASSGLVYEMRTTNMAHQLIAVEIQKMINEFREAEQKHLGYTRLRDADVLRALVFLLRMALSRTSGRPRSRAFVDFLCRQFPEQASALTIPDSGSRLIVP